jgi:hypothetical protein
LKRTPLRRPGAGAGGRVTVFVSLRFPTVSIADLILSEGGRIAGSGMHQQLTGHAGLSTELDDLQVGVCRSTAIAKSKEQS